MRRYTDTYNAARLAKAKPIILAYVITEKVCRCFGVETPQEAHLDSSLNVFDWQARVLAFGDYTQRIASDSDNVFLSLIEEEMSTYTLTCDNTDHYFSVLSGKETFLGGTLTLVQGFEYPSFVASDFQQIFTGTITRFRVGFSQCTITAKQTTTTVAPDDPTISTETLYTLSNAGSGNTAASDTFPYADMEPVFYADEDWTFIVEFERDSDSQAEELFRIENNAYDSIRLEIGIDASDYPYVKYTDDVDTGSPSYTTKTADFSLSSGGHRLEISVDATAGTLTIADKTGNIYIVSIVSSPEYSSQFGSSGTGNEEFNRPHGIAIDGSGNIWVVDTYNHRVQKFNSSGVYQSQFGSAGSENGEFAYPNDITIDEYGNLWITDANNHRVQKFNSSGVYQSQFGSYGTENGELANPVGITIDTSGNIWVVDSSNERVQKFNSSGVYQSQFGSSGTGKGEFSYPGYIVTDTLNNIYVSDTSNYRIQKFDSSGTYLLEWGSEGTGNGEFNYPEGMCFDTNGDLLVCDEENDRVQKFNTSGVYQSQFGSAGTGNGEFDQTRGVAIDAVGNIYVSDRSNHRVQKFTPETTLLFDMSETTPTSNDDIIIGDGFEGDITTCKFNDTFALTNTTGSGDFEDTISGLDITPVDGSWVDSGIDLNTDSTAYDFEYAVDATDDLPLLDTSRYSNPGPNQQNIPLPLPYGNLIENSDSAVWVCPCIDSTAYVYCVAGWPIQSVANGNTVSVYVDGVLQSSGYTFDESNDYESQGNVAIVDFTADPGGTVSVRCNGKWVDGALLTNPVDIIEDFIDYAATRVDNVGWQMNATSFAQGKAYCDENSFVAAGVILSNNSLGYWIKNILASFLGSFNFNAAGEIELTFLPTTYVENVIDTLYEYEAINLTVEQDLQNVLGQIITNYAVSFAEIDRRYKNNALTSYFQTIDETGTTTIAGAKVLTLNFDWNRKSQSVYALHEILFALYGDVQKVIKYQGQDFKFLPLDLLDQIETTLTLVRDSDGGIVEDGIYELKEKVINLDDFTSTLRMHALNPLTDTLAGSRLSLNTSRLYLGNSQIRLGG